MLEQGSTFQKLLCFLNAHSVPHGVLCWQVQILSHQRLALYPIPQRASRLVQAALSSRHRLSTLVPWVIPTYLIVPSLSLPSLP